jgi:hypothetical protein
MDNTSKKNATNVQSPPSAGRSEPVALTGERLCGITPPNMRPPGGAPSYTQTIEQEFYAYASTALSPEGTDKLIFWKVGVSFSVQ